MVIGRQQAANEKNSDAVVHGQYIQPRRRHTSRVLGFVALWLSFIASATELSNCIVQRQDGVAVQFTVELATTQAARRQGLMARPALAARHGMWFDFETEMAVVMWMKNTWLSLDMAFVDESGVIVHTHERTEPLSLEHLTSPNAARYVLEVNGGEFAALGIERGARVVMRPLSRVP